MIKKETTNNKRSNTTQKTDHKKATFDDKTLWKSMIA